MVHVLIAPDRCAGALSSAQVATALARGWAAGAPHDETEALALSDGGPGFLDAISAAVPGESLLVTVRGPHGEPVPAQVLMAGDVAHIEAAEAVGLHLVEAGTPTYDPTTATTEGVADLLLAALDAGARRVVVGVGGTATTDGGQGLVAALGGLDAARERLAGVDLVAATATDAPLLGHSGAAHGFAAAKGADRDVREQLEERLRRWATETDGGLAVRPGAGAGGGLGFGLLLLGAERVNGAALVAETVGLDERVRAADLVLTAVADLDWEVLRGRVVVAVARAAQQVGRATVVLAGSVEVGRRELAAAGIDAAYALAEGPGGAAGPVTDEALAGLARRVARTWSRR